MVNTLFLDVLSETRKLSRMSTPFATRSPPLLDARFAQIEEMCEQVRLWDLDLRPLSRIDGQHGAGRVVQTRTRELDIGYCGLNASFDQFGAAPPGKVTFVIKSAQTGRLWWRGRDTDSNEVLVYRRGSEIRCINGAGFSVYTISASHEMLAGICESMKILLPREEVLPETFLIEFARMDAIRQVMQNFRDGVAPQSGDAFHRILESLVRTWAAQAATRSRPRPGLRARDRALRVCLDYLEAVDLAELETSDLRRASGVSERTLQYAFHERFGISPAAFVKARRLTQVRHVLLRPSLVDRPIGEIAASLGIWHHGHFTAAYKLLFGETPSETRTRRIRTVF
jgi:AraC-like DNA-binding protein